MINKETKHIIESIFSRCIPDEMYLKMIYRIYCKTHLNLDNPITYNEKIQWYKLFYHDPLMTKCADKYIVHEYVRKCGLGNILTKQYKVYNNAEEINFDELPPDCFLKCNHNSAGNHHWRMAIDYEKREIIRKMFTNFLKVNHYNLSKEWAYKDIQPKIICEETLKAISPKDFVDYNVFCFYGEPKFVMYNIGLCDENGDHSDGKRAVLTTDFKPLGMKTAVEELDLNSCEKSDDFGDIINYATILSKPFPHVRVDFFYVNGKIHFGEMTFYSGSGFGQFKPEKWQRKIGDMFVLPNKMI